MMQEDNVNKRFELYWFHAYQVSKGQNNIFIWNDNFNDFYFFR
jgi:hypothetical protein